MNYKDLIRMTEVEIIENLVPLLEPDFFISREVCGTHTPTGKSIRSDMMLTPRDHVSKNRFPYSYCILEVKSPALSESHQWDSRRKLFDFISQCMSASCSVYNGELCPFCLMYPPPVDFMSKDYSLLVQTINMMISRINVVPLHINKKNNIYHFGQSISSCEKEYKIKLSTRRVGSRKVKYADCAQNPLTFKT